MAPTTFVQVTSILMSRHLRYLDPPLSFYILTVYSVLLNDIFAGIKVGSVITTLLATYAICYLVRYITNPAGGLAASLLYLFSPMLVRMMFDLIKNAMGLTFLAFTLLFCYLAAYRRRLLYSVFASVFAVLTGLTHILDFAIMYFTILLLLVLTIALSKKELKYVTSPFAASTVILVLGFTCYSIMGGDPCKGVSFINMLPKQLQHLVITSHSISAVAYPLAVGVAGVAFALTRKNTRAISNRLIISVSVILILLNIPLVPHQFLWRFNLMTAILAPLITGVIIGGIGKLKHVLLITLILMGLTLPQFVDQIQSIRPSISPEE
ncbi:MAG: glycosyltransferase family 39 protein [Desulfurococcales archaeon]|nr:glycosyltransferase family 39 protein [Desulfurococcales archaeon]